MARRANLTVVEKPDAPDDPMQRLEALLVDHSSRLRYAVDNCVSHTERLSQRISALELLVRGLASNMGSTEQKVAAVQTLVAALPKIPTQLNAIEAALKRVEDGYNTTGNAELKAIGEVIARLRKKRKDR